MGQKSPKVVENSQRPTTVCGNLKGSRLSPKIEQGRHFTCMSVIMNRIL